MNNHNERLLLLLKEDEREQSAMQVVGDHSLCDDPDCWACLEGDMGNAHGDLHDLEELEFDVVPDEPEPEPEVVWEHSPYGICQQCGIRCRSVAGTQVFGFVTRLCLACEIEAVEVLY